MSRQHFKISKGIAITPVAARPSDPENGDMIYNSTNNKFERYENGAWVVGGNGDIRADGTVPFTAAQSMGGFKLTNLGAPTVDADATTKLYVDTLVSGRALRSLSNLTAPTQINQELRFLQATAGVLGTANNTSSTQLTITSGTASAGSSGPLIISTGSASINNPSGNITLQTGAVSGTGTRGAIRLNDASLATAAVGNVWTITDTASGAGNWQALPAGSIQNFIVNGNADNGTSSIFTTYNDSSTTRPVDGVGGAGITVTTSTTTTAPINSNRSFLLTKPESNCQGQGWAISNISIPLEFRAKPLRHYLAYLVNSGTFVAGSNGSSPTDGDVIVYFYDQTNGKLVESSNIKFLANSTTIVDSQSGEVQFDSNCTTVRMIIHIASTSTAAWELKVDSVSLSNQLVNQSALSTKWTAYTPIFSNLGTPTQVEMFYRLEGPDLIVAGRWTNGTVGAGTATFSLPPVGSVDLPNSRVLGVYGHQGSATGELLVWAGGNNIQFGSENWQVPTTGTQLATGGFTTVSLSVPIIGQSASIKLSEPGDDRPYLVSANISAASQTIPTGVTTKINLNAQAPDTQGAYDSVNNRYRIFSAQDYKISGQVCVDFTTAIFNMEIFLYVNGVNANRTISGGKSGTGNTRTIIPFNFTYPFKAGDYYEFYCVQGSGSSISFLGNGAAGQITNFIIEKNSGSQQIATSEDIEVIATNGSGQVIPTGVETTITGWSVTENSHGFFNGTTGVFTALQSRFFDFDIMITFQDTVASGNRILVLYDLTNSTSLSQHIKPFSNTGAGQFSQNISFGKRMKAGDQISIRAFQDSGSNQSLLALGVRNTLRIKG